MTDNELKEWKQKLLSDRKNLQAQMDQITGEMQRLNKALQTTGAQMNATNGALNLVDKQIQQSIPPKPGVSLSSKRPGRKDKK